MTDAMHRVECLFHFCVCASMHDTYFATTAPTMVRLSVCVKGYLSLLLRRRRRRCRLSLLFCFTTPVLRFNVTYDVVKHCVMAVMCASINVYSSCHDVDAMAFICAFLYLFNVFYVVHITNDVVTSVVLAGSVVVITVFTDVNVVIIITAAISKENVNMYLITAHIDSVMVWWFLNGTLQ